LRASLRLASGYYRCVAFCLASGLASWQHVLRILDLSARTSRTSFFAADILMPTRMDKTVLISTKDSPQGIWAKTALDPGPVGGENGKFPDTVWPCLFLAGNILAVSCGDGKVTLWKKNLKDVWECVSEMLQ